MNRRQIDTTIRLFHQAIGEGNSEFTLQNKSDLDSVWDHAVAIQGFGFKEYKFSITYRDNNEIHYSVWARSLSDWCAGLLQDKEIVSNFEWDATRVYHKGISEGRFERLYDEPWTADSWWDIQTSLPSTGKPLCIIFYADKTRLSSFGSVKGHPVMVRCANLPVHIRNSQGVGGGRLVGWLPILSEVASEARKKAFVNHKREVWHEAVSKIFDSMQDWMKFGTVIKCGDGVERHIFPRLLMISADFEEQSDIALTRGNNASFPCPVCLVPKLEQPNLSVSHELRTTQNMRDIWTKAQDLNQAGNEALLQSFGLRDVENTFWRIEGADVYSALSWDRLHAYHGGLFSDHLLVELKGVIEVLGRSTAVDIDEALQNTSKWPGLAHFDSLASTGDMADGSKLEDISKVIVFASLGVITSQTTQRGWNLLQLIRCYQELDMFTSLTVQTESTLEEGSKELLRFEKCIKEYEQVHPDKSWAFPKSHTHQHVFRDIKNKGASRNYNTKPNEKANGPLKVYYQKHTNFKNVAQQILKVSDKDLVSTIIRAGITALDFEHAEETRLRDAQIESAALPHEAPSPPGPDMTPPTAATSSTSRDDINTGFQRVLLCSRQHATTVNSIETLHPNDAAFKNLRLQLARYFIDRIVGLNRLSLRPDHEIIPFCRVDIYFSSAVNWRMQTDILRVNPNFYTRPRHDYALINVDIKSRQVIAAQLLYLFKTKYNTQEFELALVLPFDEPVARDNRVRRDQALQLKRLRPRQRQQAVIVDVNAIVRGALLTPDPASEEEEMFLVDSVDEDMWMRLKNVTFIQRANI